MFCLSTSTTNKNLFQRAEEQLEETLQRLSAGLESERTRSKGERYWQEALSRLKVSDYTNKNLGNEDFFLSTFDLIYENIKGKH